MLNGQGIVPCRMIGDPIQNHMEPQFMGRRDESLHVLHRTEFRVDGAIIPNGIGASQCSKACLDSDRMDRHQPDDVYTKALEARQIPGSGNECPFLGELPQTHLICDGVARPCGMAQGDIGLPAVD